MNLTNEPDLAPSIESTDYVSHQDDEHASSASAYERLQFTDPRTLQGRPIPEREWIVPGWLSVGTVTMNYAAGGEGKTLLAQQLMASVATGKPWLGIPVKKLRTMGLFCEDDSDEMQRRQALINTSYEIDFCDLENMQWSCPVGDDNTMLQIGRDGAPMITRRFHDFWEQALKYRPRVIVLDVLADLFGGNENNRNEVTTFVKTVLGRLARDCNAAVLLNGHPSRTGQSSGEIDGGSTAWNASVRSRWALETPKAEAGQARDIDARVLTKKKANYSTRGEAIKLRYVNGVLSVDRPGIGRPRPKVDDTTAENVFLDILDKMDRVGRHASQSRNAGTYAPRMFSKQPDCQGITMAGFEAAMERLFGGERIQVVPYGKPRDGKMHIVRKISFGSCDDGE